MAEFNGIIGTITVDKNMLSVDNQHAGGMFSANLIYNVKFVDDFWDGFEVLEWYAANSYAEKTELCIYDSSAKTLTIPYGRFTKDGNLYISFRGIKNNIKYASNLLILLVGQNINIEDNDVVDDPSWLDKVSKIIDEVFKNKYDPQYQELYDKVDEQIDVNATLLTKANEQQHQIDNAIDAMGDYDVVSEDPTQIRFKKGNGQYGDTVHLGDGLASKAMVNAGYYTHKGVSYSGPASNYGIDIAKIEGAYKQTETNGFQLFAADELPSLIEKGGAKVVRNDDGSFTFSGSGVMSESLNLVAFFNREETLGILKEGKIYLADTPSELNQYVEVSLIGKNNKILLNLRTDDDSLTGTITNEMLKDESLALKFCVGLDEGKTITPGTIKPMLYQDGDGTFEKFSNGEFAPTPDAPIEPKFVKISNFYTSGINLFNFSESNIIKKSSNLVLKWNGNLLTYYMNNTASGSISFKLNLLPGTYYMNVAFSDSTQFKKGDIVVLNKGSQSGLVELTDEIDTITLNFANTQIEKTVSDLMLIFGDTEEPYTPFVGSSSIPTSLELQALPDGTADIWQDGNITRNIAKVIFDGSKGENWGISSLTNTYLCNISLPRSAKMGTSVLCDKFIYNESNDDSEHIRLTQSANPKAALWIDKKRLSSGDVSGLKSWLSTNPITVWYVLDEPITVPLEIPTLTSYCPFTNAWCDSEVEPRLIEWHVNIYAGGKQIEYYEDIISKEKAYPTDFEKGDCVTFGNTSHYTVLETLGAPRVYTSNKGLRILATLDDIIEIARISINQDLEYKQEDEGNINLIFEKSYPAGFSSDNCMLVGVSEFDVQEGKRKEATFTTVELDAKQVVRIFYNTTISSSKTIQLDVVLMKLPAL